MNAKCYIPWLDLAKVIGIYLMILGHQRLSTPEIGLWIYTFHMPFFFFISGLCYNPRPFKDMCVKVLNSLFVPFLIFATFWCLYYLICYIKGHLELKGLIHYVLGTYISPGKSFIGLEPLCRPIWFLLSLAEIKLLFSLFTKKVWVVVTLLLSVLLSAVLNHFNVILPLAIDSSVVAIAFFALGIMLKDMIRRMESNNNSIVVVVFIISTIIVTTISHFNGVVDINKTLTGNNLLLFYIGGLVGSVMVISFSHLTNQLIGGRSVKAIRVLSIGTILMVGFSSHMSSTIKSLLHLVLPSANLDITGFLVSLVLLLCFYPLTLLAIRYFPIILGNRKLNP